MAEKGTVVGLDSKKKELDEQVDIVQIKTKFGIYVGKAVYDDRGDELIGLDEAYELAMSQNSKYGFIYVIAGDIAELPADLMVVDLNKNSVHYLMYKEAVTGFDLSSNKMPTAK